MKTIEKAITRYLKLDNELTAYLSDEGHPIPFPVNIKQAVELLPIDITVNLFFKLQKVLLTENIDTFKQYIFSKKKIANLLKTLGWPIGEVSWGMINELGVDDEWLDQPMAFFIAQLNQIEREFLIKNLENQVKKKDEKGGF